MMEQQIKPPAEVRHIQAQDIQSIRRELENLSTEVEKNFLRIAEYLVILDERQLYLASGYASLWAFLDSIPTFNYERRTAEMLMRVWRTFGRNGKLPIPEERLIKVGYAKAYQLTRLYGAGVLTADNWEEWFTLAEEISFRELRHEVDIHLGSKEETDLWVTVSIRVPPDLKDKFDKIAQEIAFLEGITDPAEVKKRKGELILKALEDWETYYAPVLYREEFTSNEDLRRFKLKQIRDQVEGTFGLKVVFLTEDGKEVKL